MAPLTSVTPALQVVEASAAATIRPGFDAVFRDCAPFVWRVVQRLGVREADLDDVCQEVFLVVHRRLSTFQGDSTVRTWVYGICLRVASDYRRRAHNRREEPTDPLPDDAVAAGQDDAIERRRALAWLDGVLDALDDAKRDVFVLHEIEQMAMAEVADIVGCRLQTAYARFYAARKHIEAAARREQARRSSR